MKLNKFVEKKEDREECGFFKPSLAAQRQEFVAEFISTKDITTVVKLQVYSRAKIISWAYFVFIFQLDIGCGSGALLKKLVENMKLETLIGVDVSSKALASAKKVALIHEKQEIFLVFLIAISYFWRFSEYWCPPLKTRSENGQQQKNLPFPGKSY